MLLLGNCDTECIAAAKAEVKNLSNLLKMVPLGFSGVNLCRFNYMSIIYDSKPEPEKTALPKSVVFGAKRT